MDRTTRLKLPSSTRDILTLFTLSRTNQILRGKSPVFDEINDDNKGWAELVGSEILSAKVEIVPQPQEFNINLVSSDPRRGRYQVPVPQKHLCKTIRKKIIHGILQKYNLVEAKVDSGKRRKKVTKKELDEWKYKRAQGLEGWKKKPKKKIISTKRKKFTKYQPCCTCGDFHFKKVCAANDLKVNLLVRQINQKAEVIKQNMKDAWMKLEELEQTYNGMLTKTYRLQSNRICLEVLAGEPEDGHPDRCPCGENKRIEAARAEAARTEEEIRKRLEKRNEMEKERARRDDLIEKRKQKYYQSLKRMEKKDMTQQPKIGLHDQAALTKLDSKRSSLKTLDQVSELSKDLGKPLDLIVMDGAIKSVQKTYIEEGGMVLEDTEIGSLPDYMEKQLMESIQEELIEEEHEATLMDEEIKSLQSEDAKEESDEDEEDEIRARLTTDSMPFDKFLDFMEIF